MRYFCTVLLLALIAACSTTTQPGSIGVNRSQFLLVSAATVEKMAADSYVAQNKKAKAAGHLLESGPEYERLRSIAQRLIRQTPVFRSDALRWSWQISLIDEATLNASCAPGGKITFYTGIIRQLALNDDEIAAVMGHEIAHALREHGREKVSESLGQQFAVRLALAGAGINSDPTGLSDQVATVLFTLPNSREKETEADHIGLELMARAGYDPAAAISVWRKMSAASQGQPPQFLSTHPSHSSRIDDLTALQPVVQPLYAASKRR